MMRINDLLKQDQVNEGILDKATDAFKRSGFMGQDNKQASLSKQRDERAKSIGMKDFTNKLNSALQSAIKGGIVSVPSSNSTQSSQQTPAQQKAAEIEADRERLATGTNESKYKLYNNLIENEILKEAESISQFITSYINNQTRGLVDNSSYQQNINMIAKKLEDQYSKTKKLDSGLIEQAWETIWAWSQLGKRNNNSSRSDQSVTNKNDQDNDGIADDSQRDTFKKSIIKLLTNIDFNDAEKLKSLENPIKELLTFIQGVK